MAPDKLNISVFQIVRFSQGPLTLDLFCQLLRLQQYVRLLATDSHHLSLTMCDSNIEWRGRGRPRIDTKFDDWRDVEDKKARKRIQDRLAQRARRKSSALASNCPTHMQRDNVCLSLSDYSTDLVGR